MEKSTVFDIKERFKATGTVKNRPCRGCPPILSPRGRRRFVYFARKNDRLTWEEAGKEFIPKLSQSTAYHDLKDEAKQIKLKRRFYISPKNRAARQAFAWQYKDWTDEEWMDIIFSDECYVYISGNPGNFYVTRRTDESYEDGVSIPTFGQSSVRVMVWACIVYGKKGPLLVLDYPGGKGGGMTAERYINQVLDGPLSAFYASLGLDGHDPHFQQDNACSHTAKMMLQFLKAHGIKLFPHPASSPDLNPIENIWSILKSIIRRHPRQPTSIQELKNVIFEAWDEISVEDINA